MSDVRPTTSPLNVSQETTIDPLSTLPEITVSALQSLTPRELKDLDVARLIVSESGWAGVRLAVIIPIAEYEHLIRCIIDLQGHIAQMGALVKNLLLNLIGEQEADLGACECGG